MASKSTMDNNIETDLLVEMLEVFTHNILFLRRAYPLGIFQKRRMYNCTVHRARFPSLNEYIANALRAARFLHQNDMLQKYEINLTASPNANSGQDYRNGGQHDDDVDCSPDGQAASQPKVESFVFEINCGSASADDAMNGGGRNAHNNNGGGTSSSASQVENAHAEFERLTRFEEMMRSTMLTLDAKCRMLREPSLRSTFSIRLHTTHSGQTMLMDDVDMQVGGIHVIGGVTNLLTAHVLVYCRIFRGLARRK